MKNSVSQLFEELYDIAFFCLQVFPTWITFWWTNTYIVEPKIIIVNNAKHFSQGKGKMTTYWLLGEKNSETASVSSEVKELTASEIPTTQELQQPPQSGIKPPSIVLLKEITEPSSNEEKEQEETTPLLTTTPATPSQTAAGNGSCTHPV